mmetsp:Transcript_25124/g.78850  ORF Transcript_25124/g.78850 Transcript_25124/m.78850 type:complete len:282 (-) Transcript_25124:168-1013(-)
MAHVAVALRQTQDARYVKRFSRPLASLSARGEFWFLPWLWRCTQRKAWHEELPWRINNASLRFLLHARGWSCYLRARPPAAHGLRGHGLHLVGGEVQLVLVVDGLENVHDVRLQHHAPHDDLVEHVVHAVRVEDEVQLADVLEALVERLDEDLDEVEDAEVALLLVHGEDEVERRVVPVDELHVVAPLGDAALEVVAEAVRPLPHLLEDAPDHILLLLHARHVLVELDQPRLAVVVHHDHRLDHGGRGSQGGGEGGRPGELVSGAARGGGAAAPRAGYGPG